MGNKARPNDPCPCGSGKKFKKCCDAPTARRIGHTAADRAAVFGKLDDFIEDEWVDEEQAAFEDFWGRFLDREDELPPDLLSISGDVQDMWFAFDWEIEPGVRVADRFVERAALSPGERAFVAAMRASSMRLYEVIETVPGSSMTLRDAVEGTVVKVNERSASRTITRHEHVAARVIPSGCSGGPEIEAGVLHIPRIWCDSVLAAVREAREDFFSANPLLSIDDFYKEMPLLFHHVWLRSIFEPAVPELRNTDGEAMVVTRVSFYVDDADALARALDGAANEGIIRLRDGAWEWSSKGAEGTLVALGTCEISGDVLTMETNSVERGARGRALVEKLAGAAVHHRATTHEDLRKLVMERVTAQALGRGDEESDGAAEVDPDVAEALVAAHYARHYRAWIDEPVPALDGRTPRDAAQHPAMRDRVEALIHDLESMYERALKSGQPAYDPSWMWDELGLAEETDASYRPPLAHERVYERVPGSAEACRAAAERLRRAPGFEDATTVVDDDAFRTDLDLQRFVRTARESANDSGAEGAIAAPYLRLMLNFELHRRKAFWVDAPLAYMLEHTDVDVAGSELRVPFPSFAIALTDRHALSLGERLLSRKADDPLRGQILRVITVYVTEVGRGEQRALEIALALDALGADLPSLVRYEIPGSDDSTVRAFLDSVAPPPPAVDPPVPDPSPARGLLRLVINAIVYATSAGVTPEIRTAPARPKPQNAVATPSSDSVYFLPGAIDIHSVRRLEELERAPEGRAMLARFMVRGHWRRPQKGWQDQRLRWIEPYWKGPDLAAVIERVYRLKP